MPDSKNKRPQQSNKPDMEPITKARTSTLSSLSNLPPLTGINHPMKQPAESYPGISQSKDMHQLQAMIDIGLGMYAQKGYLSWLLENTIVLWALTSSATAYYLFCFFQ
jgi:hypothetical protein